jgi:hypothetical protein
MKMTVRIAQFIAAFYCAAFFVTPAKAQAQFGRPLEGRPINASDLSGKKLCWDTGYWDIFAANGDYSNIRSPKPHMKWSVPEVGVVHTGSTYWQAEILPDGQYYLHRFTTGYAITGHMEHWAKVCN